MYLNEELFIDFLNVKEILWTGINFAKAHFTQKGFDFSQEVLQNYLKDWNTLIINDQKKYDIRMSFRKPVVNYDLSMVSKINKSLKPSQLLIRNLDITAVLSEEQVRKYVGTLDLPKAQKYALMILVESFDNDTKMAALWVTVVRTEDSEMVLCEKFLKTPSGIGTRNYWARTFYNLLFDIKTHAYLRWENMVKQPDDHTDIAAKNNNTDD
jgi:hypothetical protein